jgi:hypothetical protein
VHGFYQANRATGECTMLRELLFFSPLAILPFFASLREATMAKDQVTHIEGSHDVAHDKAHTQAHIVPLEEEATEDAKHVDLSWRSWVVVFVCCFAYVATLWI